MKFLVLFLALFVVAFATENEQKEDQPQEQTVADDQENDAETNDEDASDNDENSEDEEISEDDLDIPNEDAKHYRKHYPCNKKCGTGIYHAAGKCNYRTGRCECVYGFTGPHSRYVKHSYPPNKIVADHCTQPCHYTHDYRNKKCVYRYRYHGYGYKQHHVYKHHKKGSYPSKKTHNYGYDEYNCHWKCGFGRYHAAGKCVGRNRCLCWWGFTGRGAKYVRKGYYKGRIVANYCTRPCHYTHDYRNPKCGYYHGNRHFYHRH